MSVVDCNGLEDQKTAQAETPTISRQSSETSGFSRRSSKNGKFISSSDFNGLGDQKSETAGASRHNSETAGNSRRNSETAGNSRRSSKSGKFSKIRNSVLKSSGDLRIGGYIILAGFVFYTIILLLVISGIELISAVAAYLWNKTLGRLSPVSTNSFPVKFGRWILNFVTLLPKEKLESSSAYTNGSVSCVANDSPNGSVSGVTNGIHSRLPSTKQVNNPCG